MAVKALPCPTLLRLLLDYDHETGALTWKPRQPWMSGQAKTEHGAKVFNGKFAGKQAFTAPNTSGHLQANFAGRKKTHAHRVAWAIFYGAYPNGVLDHADGDAANNAIANLRECGQQRNTWNMTAQKSGSSKYKGVCKTGDRWRAYIVKNGKQTGLGSYATEDEAAKAYDRAANGVFGVFARLNMPIGETNGSA